MIKCCTSLRSLLLTSLHPGSDPQQTLWANKGDKQSKQFSGPLRIASICFKKKNQLIAELVIKNWSGAISQTSSCIHEDDDDVCAHYEWTLKPLMTRTRWDERRASSQRMTEDSLHYASEVKCAVQRRAASPLEGLPSPPNPLKTWKWVKHLQVNS